MHIHNIREK
jgi:hypothetical protein